MVQCGGTFIFFWPQWLFLTPFSDSSPTVVPGRCQSSRIYVNPVLEKQEKTNCAFRIAQSEVLAFSLLVAREHIYVHPRTVARGTELSLSLWNWRWASSHPNGTPKKLGVLGSSKRDVDAGKLTSKYPSQPHNIQAWPLLHVQQGWGCPFAPWVGQVWSEGSDL